MQQSHKKRHDLPEYLSRVHYPFRIEYPFYPSHQPEFFLFYFHIQIGRFHKADPVLPRYGAAEFESDLEYLFNQLPAFAVFLFVVYIDHDIDMNVPVTCVAEAYDFDPAALGQFP